MTRLEQTESEIVNSIIQYLSYKKVWCWRNNTGASKLSYTDKDNQVHKRFFRFGVKGSPDITGILKDGKRLDIEVKRPGKEPTDVQQEFIDRLKKNGGVAFCAHSIEEVFYNLFEKGYIK